MGVIELAWAAGFFDGEGCALAARNPSGTYPGLSISQSSDDGVPEVLTRFVAAVGAGGVHGREARPEKLERQHVYLLQISGKNAVRVAHLLWPYLGSTKKDRIRAAFARTRCGYDCTLPD